MKKKLIKIISSVLCLTLVFVMFGASLSTSAVTQAEIDRLKKQQASDKAVLDAIRSRISEINAQIMSYNKKINSISSTINANKEKIAQSEKEIESDKKQFKKRLRSIRMSDSDSPVRILAGATSFANLLQISQLTKTVSSHDQQLMEDLAAKIKELNEKNAENEKLMQQQIEAKNAVAAKQAELNAQEADAAKIYNKTSTDLKAAQEAKKAEEARIRSGSGSASTPNFINDNSNLLWPVAGFYNISAGYQSNDAVHRGSHNGIDIAGGSISGQPIRAITDGYVEKVNNSCTHNYKKNSSCGCGGGYGNYCVVNHGTINGAKMEAYYAHAVSIIVSPGQHVSRGQTLGYVGTTGWSTGYHLHFGLLRNGGWVNPSNYSYSR